ncbi:50S ribosomal protein L27 [Candidatus Falkowbacteria bacterium CG23_combo_of_CG06-09_8_20_14_all_49_15]|uniref:Large ribosomal subunit protein bL27 n=1 Tax=Candidatus Falkowbacteria bacterium CG23_combo_of_CG06-09_8_20_14_all_49_15 TaxID=1974572 RepID=A0A2G9ZLP5_9BACT|nr:MAG: 50S ribosomal protein L27 [Candidatus Falkowbacteria bacterium CG23_combo_of_CG06-09_8_20_14_all_49_15]
MAHKLAAGSTTLGRDSKSKRLGIKLQDGEYAKSGAIIVRQRGTKYHPGKNTQLGKDDTIFSIVNGLVKFSAKKVKSYDGNWHKKTFVNVVPAK